MLVLFLKLNSSLKEGYLLVTASYDMTAKVIHNSILAVVCIVTLIGLVSRLGMVGHPEILRPQ